MRWTRATPWWRWSILNRVGIPVRRGTIQRVAFVILTGQRGRILPDSQRAAECRVSLKLSAIAYAQSRVGLDADRMSGTAAGWLGHCALRYCEALDDEPVGSRSLGEPTDGVVAALSRWRTPDLAWEQTPARSCHATHSRFCDLRLSTSDDMRSVEATARMSEMSGDRTGSIA